jgi:GT2 family glycosyltransferase
VTELSAVVVLHDSEPELRRLLASIDAHLPGRVELVVVDTGSADGGAAVAREWGATVVDLPDNPGFGPANNAGVAHVSHDVTALLNPDVELLDDGLLELTEAARATDALHFPRLLNPDGTVQDTAHPPPGTWREVARALLPHRAVSQPYATGDGVGWVIAAAVVARTQTLRRLGPFDPDAFMFYEDMDLCLRADVPLALKTGVVLRHEGGHSTGPAKIADEARRRRAVVEQNLGRAALRRDDLAQALTFARTAAWKPRSRAQLKALRDARRGSTPA